MSNNRNEAGNKAYKEADEAGAEQDASEVLDQASIDALIEEEGIADESDAEGADEPSEIESIAQLKLENSDLKDRLLRTHAEMDNVRKRAERQVADAHKFGIEKFATGLLDVVDNLERALAVDEGNETAVREGVQLTLNSWNDMMKRFHVERIDAVGEQFDPHQHEALTKMASEEPEGTVIAQHVAGYNLHGRLIRAAKVLVSSGPAEQ
ncbi:MAG: nucleotide exchange factor GrpE [Mariprofundus sp.]|nr:nucleotide exchange factor GrpE [Mariprofundus sp.]